MDSFNQSVTDGRSCGIAVETLRSHRQRFVSRQQSYPITMSHLNANQYTLSNNVVVLSYLSEQKWI